jgi:hypothetical protein
MTKQEIVRELYLMRDNKDRLLYALHQQEAEITKYEEMLKKMKQLEAE